MTEEFEEKKILLEHFINTADTGPAQKTPEWYAIKSKTIGGSEIATLLGLNPYSTKVDLIKEKCQLGHKFNGSLATRWGTMFEDVTRKFTEFVLQMPESIVELGSLEGVLEGQRYSPDGLGLAYLVDKQGEAHWYIVLFEFKSPLRSLPNLKIPKHYLPQVLMGLESIGITDLAIFTNISYRKCTFKQLNFDYLNKQDIIDANEEKIDPSEIRVEYDINFHQEKKKLTKAEAINMIYAAGMVIFYQSEENYRRTAKSLGFDEDEDEDDDFDFLNDDFICLTEHDMHLCYDSVKTKPYDLGAASVHWMESLMILVDAKRIQYTISPLLYNKKAIRSLPITKQNHLQYDIPEVNVANHLKKWCNETSANIIGQTEKGCKNRIVGYMPFKVVKADIIQQERDPNFLETIRPEVGEFLAEITRLNSLPSDERQTEFYKKYQPDMLGPEIAEEDIPRMTISYEEPVLGE